MRCISQCCCDKGNRSRATLCPTYGNLPLSAGQPHRELKREGIERESSPKTRLCVCVCGGCLVIEKGVVGVKGAERETDCRYGGGGEESKR